MRTIFGLFLMMFSLVVLSSGQSSADQRALSGFLPFGYYQPYGAVYRNAVPNPPYFATNPPVYYGARYSRPYGMSPFAAPPVLQAANGYRGAISTPSASIELPESASRRSVSEVLRPQQKSRPMVDQQRWVHEPGRIRTNPFAVPADGLVKQ